MSGAEGVGRALLRVLGGRGCSGRRGALEAGADAGWRVPGHGVGGRGVWGALGGRAGVPGSENDSYDLQSERGYIVGLPGLPEGGEWGG